MKSLGTRVVDGLVDSFKDKLLVSCCRLDLFWSEDDAVALSASSDPVF